MPKFPMNLVDKESISFHLFHEIHHLYYSDVASHQGNKLITFRIWYENSKELQKKLERYIRIVNKYRKIQRVKSIVVEKRKLTAKKKVWYGEMSSRHGTRGKDTIYNQMLVKLKIQYKW